MIRPYGLCQEVMVVQDSEDGFFVHIEARG